MDYSDLRNKTILDFTDDPKVIANFIDEDMTLEEYKAVVGGVALIEDFIGLAELWNDKELKKAIDEQFADEFEKWGFE